jgi:hypothetical protein
MEEIEQATVNAMVRFVEHPKPRKQEPPYERFKRFTTRVVSVPRAEIQKRELQWKNGRKHHKSHHRHR